MDARHTHCPLMPIVSSSAHHPSLAVGRRGAYAHHRAGAGPGALVEVRARGTGSGRVTRFTSAALMTLVEPRASALGPVGRPDGRGGARPGVPPAIGPLGL